MAITDLGNIEQDVKGVVSTAEEKLKADLAAGRKYVVDIRNSHPDILKTLGVNTNSEKEVLHGAIGLLLNAVFGSASAEDIANLVADLKGIV